MPGAKLKAKLNIEMRTEDHQSQPKVKRSGFRTVVILWSLICFHMKQKVEAELVYDLDLIETKSVESMIRIDGEQHTRRAVVKSHRKTIFHFMGNETGPLNEVRGQICNCGLGAKQRQWMRSILKS